MSCQKKRSQKKRKENNYDQKNNKHTAVIDIVGQQNIRAVPRIFCLRGQTRFS